jgi:hypothetical protein
MRSDVGAKSIDDCYKAGMWELTTYDSSAYNMIPETLTNLPDFLNLPVIGRAYLNTINLPNGVTNNGAAGYFWRQLIPGTPDGAFVATIQGRFLIKTAGAYTICYSSAGGSQLNIDGVRVGSDPKDHGVRDTYVPLYLDSGVHSALLFLYDYSSNDGHQARILYSGPDTGNQLARLECTGNPKIYEALVSQNRDNCRVHWPSDLQPTPRQQQCKAFAETYCTVACVTWGDAKGKVSALVLFFLSILRLSPCVTYLTARHHSLLTRNCIC